MSTTTLFVRVSAERQNMADHESLYEDIGSHAKPEAYDDCGHLECEVCKAPPKKACINPITGKPRKLPCVGRIPRMPTPRGAA